MSPALPAGLTLNWGTDVISYCCKGRAYTVIAVRICSAVCRSAAVGKRIGHRLRRDEPRGYAALSHARSTFRAQNVRLSAAHGLNWSEYAMARQLLFLEFNEINFEGIAYYAERGLLPNLKTLIEQNGWATTTSENRYQDIEPWIQWVTAHTGRTLAEHNVFRLGDITEHDLLQIWEYLEANGLRVGAISPMNAKNRLREPAFFVPDPWTRTKISGPAVLANLHNAIVQLVGDNAKTKLTFGSAFGLLAGLAAYVAPRNYARYASLIVTSLWRTWRRAILLDVLLSDVFILQVRRTVPNFATLFLNAGAHIQHHYLFSAQCYRGRHRNPEWYVVPNVDPIREVYEAYDGIFGAIRAEFPAARVMIATGLHQDPHGEGTYYWRLRNHAYFLRRIEVPFVRVEPRMSRDFLIVCACAEHALQAQARLSGAVAKDGLHLFEVDNRGSDLFVTLTYPREVSVGFDFSIGKESFSGFDRDVVFVALKNGQHNGTGYFLDTEANFRGRSIEFELKYIPRIIAEALGVNDPLSSTLGLVSKSDAA